MVTNWNCKNGNKSIMVWNEISRFLQEFFNEKKWKNIKFIQILQNRIYFVKKKKWGSSIWVTLINIDYLISRKLPSLISIWFYLLWAHFCLYIFIWILVKYEAKIWAVWSNIYNFYKNSSCKMKICCNFSK